MNKIELINKIKDCNLAQIDDALTKEIFTISTKRITDILSSKWISVTPESFGPNFDAKKHRYLRQLSKTEILRFINKFPFYNGGWPKLIRTCFKNNELEEMIFDKLYNSKEIKKLRKEFQSSEDNKFSDFDKAFMSAIAGCIDSFITCRKSEYSAAFTPEIVRDLLLKNKRYKKVLLEEEKYEKYLKLITKDITSIIPASYPELYPLARTIKRHFVLHVGPTNSGKTYSATAAFTPEEESVYLAPLRLLAFEQYETLNRNGIICSMKTGEERIEVPGATCTASTIEMANLNKEYDVAVIDEAQLISDFERGGAWTNAILGLAAKTIHVCMSAEAEDVIIKLINACDDTYEVVKHERYCPLNVDKNHFNFPKSVQKGDALIVFSRKDVHAVAAELQRKDIKTSIIYGRLPYDVRHAQAEAFASGETDVLVATDAIGMGLNLPIKRVVFLTNTKFDGVTERYLTPQEIQQIAGRAGRRGKYPEGLVTAFTDKKFMMNFLRSNIKSLEYAVMTFPENLVSLNFPLEDILKQWNDIPLKEGFIKSNVENEIALCHTLAAENITDNDFLYSCITIPFDISDEYLFNLWKVLCIKKAKNDEIILSNYLPKVYSNKLEVLEHLFRICDLVYSFADRFNYTEYFDEILKYKKELSNKIIKILDKQKLNGKTCKNCGCFLPWTHQYGYCNECYEDMFYNSNYYDDYYL